MCVWMAAHLFVIYDWLFFAENRTKGARLADCSSTLLFDRLLLDQFFSINSEALYSPDWLLSYYCMHRQTSLAVTYHNETDTDHNPGHGHTVETDLEQQRQQDTSYVIWCNMYRVSSIQYCAY